MATEYELSLDPNKKQPKFDAAKSAKKVEKNEQARLQSFRDNPPNTKGHFRFQYNSSNQDHRSLIGTLLNNGLADDIVIHPDNTVSFPRRTFIHEGDGKGGAGKEILQPQIQKVTSGILAKRASTKTATSAGRPTAPAAKKESNVDKAYKAQQASKGNKKSQ